MISPHDLRNRRRLARIARSGRLLGRRRAPVAGLTRQASSRSCARRSISRSSSSASAPGSRRRRPGTPGEQLLVQQALCPGGLDRTVEVLAGLRRPAERGEAGGPGPVDRRGIKRRVLAGAGDGRVEDLEPDLRHAALCRAHARGRCPLPARAPRSRRSPPRRRYASATRARVARRRGRARSAQAGSRQRSRTA